MDKNSELVEALKKRLEPLMSFIKSLKIHKDFHIFFAFLLLATFFWFLKALKEDYEYTLPYPVAYEKIPDNIILEAQEPTSIELKIKDTGFQLLRYATSRMLVELDFDIKKSLEQPRRKFNANHSFILCSDYEAKLQKNLATTTTILSIKPDTLHIFYSHQVSKRVPVKLNGIVEPAQQCILSGEIRLIPDSVDIYGPERMLDTIACIYTQKQVFVKLKDTLVRNISLKSRDEITISRKRVNVEVPVEMFTEKSIEVPVKGINFPDSLLLRTFPGIVNVSFFVGISHFQEVNAKFFEVSVDYNLINSKVGGNVPITVNTTHQFITNLRVLPDNVVYLVELNKKAQNR